MQFFLTLLKIRGYETSIFSVGDGCGVPECDGAVLHCAGVQVGDSILHFMAGIGALALFVLIIFTGYYIWLLFHPDKDKPNKKES